MTPELFLIFDEVLYYVQAILNKAVFVSHIGQCCLQIILICIIRHSSNILIYDYR